MEAAPIDVIVGGFPDLAKTSAMQASAPDFPGNVQDSTGKWLEPFAWYDRATQSWRTWQRCFIEGWEMWSETWPRSAMTRNGIAYRLDTLARPTSEIVSGLLPTLTKRDARTLKGGQDRPNRSGGKSLLQTMLDDGHDNGRLNPRWCEWFMGYPQMWTQLEHSETQSSRTLPNSSARRSSKRRE